MGALAFDMLNNMRSFRSLVESKVAEFGKFSFLAGKKLGYSSMCCYGSGSMIKFNFGKDIGRSTSTYAPVSHFF